MEVKEPCLRYAFKACRALNSSLPVDWQLTRVEDAGAVLGGRQRSPSAQGEPTPYLRVANVFAGWIDTSDVLQMPFTADERARFALRAGDILLNEGQSLELVGRSAIYRDEPPNCCFQNTLVRFRAGPRTDPNYAQYVFESYLRRGEFSKIALQTTSIAHLGAGRFAQMPFVAPPLAEQKAIGQALADADALIDSLEQLLTKKRQVKQGAMQELLTGKRRLPGFQGNWGEATFADVAFIDPENLGSGTPAGFSFNYIALEGVNQGRLDSFAELRFDSAPSRARRVLRNGDILVSTVRPNLKSHLLLDTLHGNWIASTGFSVVRGKPGIACPGFLFALLFSSVIEQQIDALLTGSNYPAINGRDVANLVFPCPPFDEQIAIAESMSDMDAEIAALESRLTKARDLKQAMAQALLTGRIRIPSSPQEPTA